MEKKLKKLIFFCITFLVTYALLISLAGCGCSPLTVVTVQANLITTNSATLFGHLQYHGSAGSVELFFQYGTADDALNEESEKETLVEVRPGDFFKTVENLRPNTRYSYRAVAIADPGSPNQTTDYGDVLHFTTESIEPLEAEDVEQEPPEGEVTEQEDEEPIGDQEEEEEEQLPQTGEQEESEDTDETGLIAYWNFNEGIGGIAYDSVGDNHGTLIGDTHWVNGPTGYEGALAFDGDGDYVEIANEHNFDFDKNDTFTIEAWVKTRSNEVINIISKMPVLKPATGYQLLKHGYDDTSDPDGGNRIFFFLDHVYDSTDGFINTDAIVVYGSTDITDDEWHHVKVTYDGSCNANSIKIFVDGELENMHVRNYGENKGLWDTLSGSILNDVPLQISGREEDINDWDGLIDEVKIWRGIH